MEFEDAVVYALEKPQRLIGCRISLPESSLSAPERM